MAHQIGDVDYAGNCLYGSVIVKTLDDDTPDFVLRMRKDDTKKMADVLLFVSERRRGQG